MTTIILSIFAILLVALSSLLAVQGLDGVDAATDRVHELVELDKRQTEEVNTWFAKL